MTTLSAIRPGLLRLIAAAVACVVSLHPHDARADVTAMGGDAAAKPADEAAAAPEVPAEMRTPRAALEAFIKRMQADEKSSAAELLDLSQLSAVAAGSRGPDLAYKLFQLIPALGTPPTTGGERASWNAAPKDLSAARIDFAKAPDDAEREEPWPLSDWLRNPTPEAEQVFLSRDQQKRWRFSAATVEQIDPLYEQFESRIEEISEQRADQVSNGAIDELNEPTETTGVWLRRQFPPALRTTYFLLPNYQWLLLLALLPVGRIVEVVTRTVLTGIGDRALHRIDPEFAEAHKSTDKVWRPVGRLAHAAVWALGARAMELPTDVTGVLLTVLVIVTIVAAVVALFRALDLVSDYFARRAKRDGQRFGDLFIPLANSTAKIGVAAAGVIAALAVFSDQLPSTLLGGLGIGGIAIALASQETLSNFIGSITLLFDRPFEVGDFVKIDAVEGSVESLGFRSTRIRTGLDSEVTLPNSKLASTSIDNMGRRKYRRYLAKLGLEYGTPPDRIEAFCEGIRELVRRHPHTRKDFYAAYFNDFGPSSLDVLVVVFFEVPDWPTELRERHRLLADILRVAEDLGVSFAFPTQTLHLQRDDPPGEAPDLPDSDATRAGARIAAEIAGELPNYQDRPGPVKFSGPTQFE